MFRLVLLIHEGWVDKLLPLWDPEKLSCLCYSTYLNWGYSSKMACLSSKSLGKTVMYWPTHLHIPWQASGSASVQTLLGETWVASWWKPRYLYSFWSHGNQSLLYPGKEQGEPRGRRVRNPNLKPKVPHPCVSAIWQAGLIVTTHGLRPSWLSLSFTLARLS